MFASSCSSCFLRYNNGSFAVANSNYTYPKYRNVLLHLTVPPEIPFLGARARERHKIGEYLDDDETRHDVRLLSLDFMRRMSTHAIQKALQCAVYRSGLVDHHENVKMLSFVSLCSSLCCFEKISTISTVCSSSKSQHATTTKDQFKT